MNTRKEHIYYEGFFYLARFEFDIRCLRDLFTKEKHTIYLEVTKSIRE